jgi:ABC-type multidrug transport system fused ATPase/permease subunit
MALEVMNLRKTVATIWALLNLAQRQSARYYVVLCVVATIFEVLSLGMIIPLLYAFTSSGSAVNNGIFGFILNVPFIKNLNLSYILIFLVLLFFIKNIFFIFLARFQAKFVFGIEESLSNQIYRIYLNQPYPFFLKNNSAELLRNVMREPSQFAHNALSPLCLLIAELFISTGVVALLISINPLGAICSFILFGGVGYIFYAFAHKKISQWGKEHQIYEGKRLQNLQEGFGSIKEILIGSLQSNFTIQYSYHMHAGATAGINQQSVQSAPRLLIEIFAVIVLAITIGLFGQSDPALLLPMIGLYAAAAFRLMPGVNRIINALQSLRYSESSVHLLAKELARGNELVPRNSARKVDFNHQIQLRDLSFQYDPNSKMLFEGANIVINKGDLVFLKGPSGAGKTTLVDIICGLQKPSKGELLIDGLPVNTCITDWQNHIAYVPQTTFLLDGSIKENIVFGDMDEIDERRLDDVCKVACIDQMIESLPDGLETSVGERGSNLSGGQRQRIGIARALYRGGNLLVLDEATNALDSKLESDVIHNILAFTGGITKIWITHNLSIPPNGRSILVDSGSVEFL